jgi:hypothetical protein
MKRDTTKAAGDVADAKLFDDWFDLIEADLRPKPRGFNETTIEEAFDRFRNDSAHLLRIALALDLHQFARFEILGH